MKNAMCDAQNVFCALFDVPPRALRLWAKGRTVWCNAPLQYASLHGISKEAAAEKLLPYAKQSEVFELWQSLPNGMLQTHFQTQFLCDAAMDVCKRKSEVIVQDSAENFFFEKCLVLRARRALDPPVIPQCLGKDDLDLIADVIGCLDQPLKTSRLQQFTSALEARLDANLKQKTRQDLTSFVLLVVLETYFSSF